MRFILSMLLLLSPVAWAGPSAESLMLQGRVAEALPAARAEAEAAPGDLAAHERYIDLLLSTGLTGEADSVYRARAAARDDADSWYLLGRAVLTAEDALACYRQALTKDRAHARSYMGLGAVYRAEERYSDAAEAYRNALDLDPKLGEAWAGLGAAQLSMGRPEDALVTARQGMVNVPGDADSYLAVSVLAPQEAIEVLKRASAKVPGDARVPAALAEEYLGAGEGLAAKREAEAALAIDATRSDARLSLMFAESMAAGFLDGAGYRGLLQARATELADMSEAALAYDKLVAGYPKSPLPLMGRARVRAAQGDGPGALADLSAALTVDPSNVEAMAATGLLLLEAGRASEGKPLLRRASAERPLDASLAQGYARALKETGDLGGALTALTTAETLQPFDARLVLTHASWLSEARRSNDAYLVLREGVKRMPGDDRLVLSLAAAAKDLGRPGEAADLLDVLADRSGSEGLRELARKLRAGEL